MYFFFLYIKFLILSTERCKNATKGLYNVRMMIEIKEKTVVVVNKLSGNHHHN
jgi:hypothetical protein